VKGSRFGATKLSYVSHVFIVLAPAYRTIYFMDFELRSTWKNQGRQEKINNKEGQS